MFITIVCISNFASSSPTDGDKHKQNGPQVLCKDRLYITDPSTVFFLVLLSGCKRCRTVIPSIPSLVLCSRLLAAGAPRVAPQRRARRGTRDVWRTRSTRSTFNGLRPCSMKQTPTGGEVHRFRASHLPLIQF